MFFVLKLWAYRSLAGFRKRASTTSPLLMIGLQVKTGSVERLDNRGTALGEIEFSTTALLFYI
jgi:hypothetical protein